MFNGKLKKLTQESYRNKKWKKSYPSFRFHWRSGRQDVAVFHPLFRFRREGETIKTGVAAWPLIRDSALEWREYIYEKWGREIGKLDVLFNYLGYLNSTFFPFLIENFIIQKQVITI